MKISTCIICVLASTSLFGMAPASAVEIAIGSASHGPANCQAALPVYDGNVRKRPKAIANEGTSTAFITCDFEASPSILRKVMTVIVRLHNSTTSTQSVSCTLVDAFGAEVFSVNSLKSVELQAQANGELRWQASTDNANINYTTPSMSCAIPPGIEISGTLLSRLQDVGQ